MPSFALRNPHAVIVGALIVALLGVTAFTRMPVDVFPNLKIPAVVVATFYPGMPPTEVERDITTRFERFFTLGSDIEHMESRSLPGVSIIKVYFHASANVDTAAASLANLAMADLRHLPPGTLPPLVLKFDASSLPVTLVTVAGEGFSETELRDQAQYNVRNQLATVAGASVPPPFGGKYRQIMVYTNREALEARGLTLMDVVHALNGSNLIIPAGDAKIGNTDYFITTNSMIEDPAHINDVPVKVGAGQAPVLVRDIGRAQDASRIQLNVVRLNGKHSVYIPVLKQGNANTIAVVDGVKALLPHVVGLPAGVTLHAIFDQSSYIRAAIESLEHEAGSAAVLASLVILLFLGSFKSTLAIFVSIPLSLLAAAFGLFLNGSTTNVMTLGGFALAIGRLVDDSVVVLENINRHLAEGKSPAAAARDGAEEVALAVLASTITTVIVFFPVMFLFGVAKYLFSALSLAVVLSMLGSYVVAMTIIPIYCARFLTVEEARAAEAGGGGGGWFGWFGRGYERLAARYERVLGGGGGGDGGGGGAVRGGDGGVPADRDGAVSADGRGAVHHQPADAAGVADRGDGGVGDGGGGGDPGGDSGGGAGDGGVEPGVGAGVFGHLLAQLRERLGLRHGEPHPAAPGVHVVLHPAPAQRDRGSGAGGADVLPIGQHHRRGAELRARRADRRAAERPRVRGPRAHGRGGGPDGAGSARGGRRLHSPGARLPDAPRARRSGEGGAARAQPARRGHQRHHGARLEPDDRAVDLDRPEDRERLLPHRPVSRGRHPLGRHAREHPRPRQRPGPGRRGAAAQRGGDRADDGAGGGGSLQHSAGGRRAGGAAGGRHGGDAGGDRAGAGGAAAAEGRGGDVPGVGVGDGGVVCELRVRAGDGVGAAVFGDGGAVSVVLGPVHHHVFGADGADWGGGGAGGDGDDAEHRVVHGDDRDGGDRGVEFDFAGGLCEPAAAGGGGAAAGGGGGGADADAADSHDGVGDGGGAAADRAEAGGGLGGVGAAGAGGGWRPRGLDGAHAGAGPRSLRALLCTARGALVRRPAMWYGCAPPPPVARGHR